jgi:hypothetical protein
MQFFFLSSSSNGSKYYFLSLSFLVLSLFCAIHVLNSSYNHSFETRHGPAGRHRTRPTRGWNRVGLKKKQGKKNPVWPGKTWLKTRLQPVNFFLLKRCRFDFFIKKIDPGNLVTRSKPGPWIEPGLKTMVIANIIIFFFQIINVHLSF